MKKYGCFDKDGMPLAFYAEDVHGPYRLPIYGETPEATEEEPSPVAPMIGNKPNPAYPEDAVEISEEVWREFVENSGRRRWNGETIVEYSPPPLPPVIPAVVTDYQFAGQADAEGIITFEEAMAWTARGDIPRVLLDAVNEAVTDEARRKAVLLFLAGSKEYARNHALTPVLGSLLGKTDDAALDAFWTAAAAR